MVKGVIVQQQNQELDDEIGFQRLKLSAEKSLKKLNKISLSS